MQKFDEVIMMSANEHQEIMDRLNVLKEQIEDLEKTNERLCDVLLNATLNKKHKIKDIWVTRKDFLRIYSMALRKMDDDILEHIYGESVTVHWHGFYCDCGDGATACNYIIDNIDSVDDEMGVEESY